ncbi:outer membrane protein assembly factor BamD, partial [Campylobacter jejuni]
MKKGIFLLVFLSVFFSACSTKNDEDLYNLSASEWYKQII